MSVEVLRGISVEVRGDVVVVVPGSRGYYGLFFTLYRSERERERERERECYIYTEF